ncbi:MAG: DUF115 domain-containing protein [Spirochaetales bacterium]|nr:DUF115 domain-containing protein [Spirochaetales bacterium]
MDESILKGNLAALALRQPDLAADLAATRAPSHLRAARSTNGLLNVELIIASRRPRLLHSRHDPLREAERIADTLGPAATLVCYGSGAAWLPTMYLSRHRGASALIVENGPEALRTTIEAVDIARELSDGRLYLTCSLEAVETIVASIHHPTLRDRLVQHRLTGRDADSDAAAFFGRAASCVRAALAATAEDVATMRRFARSWFVHTVANTRTVSWAAQADRIRAVAGRFAGRRAVVLAAGPTLDDWFDAGVEKRGPIATVDTAYPAVRGRGIEPEMVVSIDPQGWTCMHLAGGVPRRTTLAADLGVSPLVFASADSAIAIAGRHPLHQLLSLRGFPVATLATAARTVTEAALLTARGLGAQDIELVGADGAFPRGATYAKATYHHRFSARHATRMRPQEHFFAERVYPSAEPIQAEPDRGGGSGRGRNAPTFSIPAMRKTRERLSELVSSYAEIPPLTVAGGTTATVRTVGDVRRFWSEHSDHIGRAIQELSDDGERSTPEILQRVGPDGQAHLPLLAALPRGGREALHREPQQRFIAVLETVRAFLFKEINR